MERGRLRLAAGPIFLLAGMASCLGPPRVEIPGSLYARRPELAGLDTRPLRGRRILIDPGHGGHFTGTRGPADQTREADVNLGVALYLWGLLRDAGAEVYLTRASDRDLLPDSSETLRDDLAARVALFDSLRPEVFLSLHHNSNAPLDRDRNAVETYYRLDDDGPSYDLARAIHRRLAQGLGITEARLRPGNYFVLRNAPAAAVLGEASYLSNPAVESQLRLADKQLLEAEAYFLGVLDYFSRGAPRIEKLEPAGDTLHAGGTLRFRITDAQGGRIDPLSVELRVDSRRVPAWFDVRHGELVLRADGALRPGTRLIEVRARNVRGNAAPPWRERIALHVPPARVFVRQRPDPAAPGSDIRLRIRLVDARGRAVADGHPVALESEGMQLQQLEDSTRAGEILAWARIDPEAQSARLVVRAGPLVVASALSIDPLATRLGSVRCLDAGSRKPVRDAWAVCEAQPEHSDRAGLLLVHPTCDSLRIERRGYAPWDGVRPANGLVRLVPVHAGHLHARTLVIDPGGDGLEVSVPDLGVSAAELNFDVARTLGSMLEAAGARVLLTRGATQEVPETERIRIATRQNADWYVRIESALQPRTRARVLHYPQSPRGEQLARAIGRRLQRRLQLDSVEVREDTRAVLQQTPCPAVVVTLPGARTDATRLGIAHTDSLRERAYALFVGILNGLAPGIETWPHLSGSVLAESGARGAGLVVLDGAEGLRPDANGGFRFECVSPGEHRLAFLQRDGTTYEIPIYVAAPTTHINVRIPGSR
ncbi:MAG: N-acetylmuramoyl-L-alanine amidase [Candidatus Krumholzibacteriia bacterium]